MRSDVLESDWKVFRSVHQRELDTYCAGVLGELRQICADSAQGPHERYVAAWRLLEERDRAIARAFNDVRRSRMFDQILAMRQMGLMPDEDLARFSDDLRESVLRIEAGR